VYAGCLILNLTASLPQRTADGSITVIFSTLTFKFIIMKEKRLSISIGIITALVVLLGACNDKKTVEDFDGKQTVVVEETTTKESATEDEGTTGGEVTGEITRITDLAGILSYYPDYQMWGVQYVIPGTIDSVDLYLIKEDVKDLSANTSIKVVCSGDAFLSNIESPLGGLTIYYITHFTYKQI
jgi:hypothetical protein